MLIAAHANQHLRGDGNLRFCSAHDHAATFQCRRALRLQSVHRISSGQPGTWI